MEGEFEEQQISPLLGGCRGMTAALPYTCATRTQAAVALFHENTGCCACRMLCHEENTGCCAYRLLCEHTGCMLPDGYNGTFVAPGQQHQEQLQDLRLVSGASGPKAYLAAPGIKACLSSTRT
eukprot:680138-Pelagomonas_calceolata.AAC.2